MPTKETSRLLASTVPFPVVLAPSWQFWHIGSPSFRLYLFVLLSLIPFSGLCQSPCSVPIPAVSVPNMLLPFVGVHVLDVQGHVSVVYFLLAMCVGHIVVTFALATHTFWLALVGRVVFGVGVGSVVVGARAMVSYWFDASELTFAMGVMVATTSVSKMLAKATVAPISIILAAIVAAQYIYTLKECQSVAQATPISPRLRTPTRTNLRGFATTYRLRVGRAVDRPSSTRSCPPSHPFETFRSWHNFWMLVVLHVVFINVFHLFQNISSSYLYQVHGYSVVKSGLVSSLSHVLVLFSPLVGLVIDRLDGRVPIIVLSAVLGVVAYGLLLFTSTPSTVSLLIMSFCLASTPAVLMACVPLNIPKSQFGLTLAFGIVEVIDATGSTVGNHVVGCLRGATGTYTADMCLFFSLAWVLLGLCITLGCLDYRNGHVLAASAPTSTVPPPQAVLLRQEIATCQCRATTPIFSSTLGVRCTTAVTSKGRLRLFRSYNLKHVEAASIR
ncbi:hypothetical protein H257_04598 [Aphanomyces astaci]|uniref:Lysosomal dipeptide transporter MFSD1 n=1 Tax=Aphanomyces astaci TaxID=112090 RepID=W4GV66_APHAT|nr:hypothetical protein H257_04598 [Aphanomyces astaci]ETV82818.1 hypothetical protein H257_04598 [Aphanomyces astaci]|eukprot:XP_009827489.1 hypothetical protein H257_04598 [Aphanomyces astaci]